MCSLWDSWMVLVRPSMRFMGDLVVKALVWNVWLARNDHIFNANVLHVHALIVKIDQMLLSWFSSCVEGDKRKLDDSMKTIRRSLEFWDHVLMQWMGIHWLRRHRTWLLASPLPMLALRKPLFLSFALFCCFFLLFELLYHIKCYDTLFCIFLCYLYEGLLYLFVFILMVVVYPSFQKEKDPTLLKNKTRNLTYLKQ